MESRGDLYCEVCQKKYQSSEIAPKCVSCGHIFCGTCVSSLTTTKIQCPKCQATISVLTAEDIDSLTSSTQKSSSISSSSRPTLKDVMLSSKGEETNNEERTIQSSSCQLSSSSSFSNTPEGKNLSDDSPFSIEQREHDNSDKEPIQNRTPIVLVQECESTQSSGSSQKNEATDIQCCDSLEIPHNNHLFPPSVIQYTTEESTSFIDQESLKSSNESDNNSFKYQFQDFPDCKYEPPIRLPVDRNIPEYHMERNLIFEQIPNSLAVSSDLRADSLVVHRSGSCDLDHIPMNLEVSEPQRTVDEEFNKIKENELQRYGEQVQILHEVLETVNDAILTLRVEQEQHESKKQNLIQMIKEEEENIQLSKLKIEEALENKNSVQQVTETLKETEDAIVKAHSYEFLKSTMMKSSESLAHAEDLGTQIEINYMQFLLSKDVQKPEYLERMIDLGVNIFAEHQINGEWRWSRVSLSDSLIHVHALTTTPPPSECRLLPWSCLKGMISAEKTSTFLDIKLAGKSHGRVYLSMFGNTHRAQQFVILSSGEHTYCYKGSKMKQLGNSEQPGEYVSFHGPKNKKGSPIRGVVSGITQGGVYTKRKTEGLLAGAALSHRQRTLFVVYLQTDPDEDTTGAFGQVTQGLEILKSASSHEPIHEVEIEDCGLVIPLSSLTS